MDFPLLKNELHMLVIDYSSINKLEKHSLMHCTTKQTVLPFMYNMNLLFLGFVSINYVKFTYSI